MSRLLLVLIVMAPLKVWGAMDKVDLRIAGHPLHVEIASTREEKNQGLMNREKLGANDGMIFVFSPPEQVNFWMKNTLIPLTLAFVDENLNIVELHDLNPPVSIMQTDIPRAESRGPVLFVIEVNQGWFKQKKIGLNTKVELVSKSQNALLTKLFATQARQKSSGKSSH